MGGIAWAQFSWEAFATLATGAMAVAAAVWVGRRQLLIAEKQASIQDRQVRLDELALRKDLFDRRIAVYDAVVAYLAHVVREKAPPEEESARSFRRAIGVSRFLFDEEVHQQLFEIALQSLRFEGFFEMTQAADAPEDLRKDFEKALEERRMWFADQLEDLPALFGKELRLTAR